MAFAKQVFESPDLVRWIYSFGDPNHRVFTDALQFVLKPLPDNFEYKYHQRALLEGDDYTVEDYLSHYTIREIEEYLTEYQRCFCCARHSRDRPRWIYPRSMYHSMCLNPMNPDVIVRVDRCLESLFDIFSIGSIGRVSYGYS